jgi:poly-beta-1,6-N-acetyl-D-glucosamine synthase
MWPGQRGDTRGQPLHPNLRLRWFEHMSMVLNIFTRLGFLLLLMFSLSISAFVFRAWWVIPPIIATALNYRVAASMAFANRKDYLFAVLLWPAEIYMWIRMGHFIRAWLKFFSRTQTDNWAAQAKAERGKGTSYLYPFLSLLVFLVASFAIWVQLPVGLRSDILSVCWPILGVLTVLQTAWMALKGLRRYRGYKA